MRAFFVSFLAFVIAGFAGSLVAQGLAEGTGAGEEFILVFMAVALVDLVASAAFFVAQLMAPTAIARVGVMLLVLVVLGGTGLAAFSLMEGGMHGVVNDWPILSGLIFPPLLVVVMQWLVVRGLKRNSKVTTAGGQALP